LGDRLIHLKNKRIWLEVFGFSEDVEAQTQISVNSIQGKIYIKLDGRAENSKTKTFLAFSHKLDEKEKGLFRTYKEKKTTSFYCEIDKFPVRSKNGLKNIESLFNVPYCQPQRERIPITRKLAYNNGFARNALFSGMLPNRIWRDNTLIFGKNEDSGGRQK